MATVNKQRIFYNEQLIPGITMPNFVKNSLVSGNELGPSPYQNRKECLGEKFCSDCMSFFNETCFFNGFVN